MELDSLRLKAKNTRVYLCCGNCGEVREALNNWLRDNPECTIIDIRLTHSGDENVTRTGMIIYTINYE